MMFPRQNVAHRRHQIYARHTYSPSSREQPVET